MGRQKQLRARVKYDCLDIEQYCPKCKQFGVVRNSRKKLIGRDGQPTNRICQKPECPGPDKGESCDPPDEAITKWIEELKFWRLDYLQRYWEARLRRRSGATIPKGKCVVCEQIIDLRGMVFDGKVAGLRCLKHDHHLY